MITLTYGILPKFNWFEEQFRKEVPNGIYNIYNDKAGYDGNYTVDELWKLIVQLTENADEKELDLASCILNTLGIEWV